MLCYGVASQVIRAQGSLEAPSKGWGGGGKRGDGDQKLPPRYHGCTAYTHYFKFWGGFSSAKINCHTVYMRNVVMQHTLTHSNMVSTSPTPNIVWHFKSKREWKTLLIKIRIVLKPFWIHNKNPPLDKIHLTMADERITEIFHDIIHQELISEMCNVLWLLL